MKYLILAALTAVSLNTSAHGEDKLGPNGGYIRMPGSYHTEIVPDGPNTLKVFFLDLSWKTQPLNSSSLGVVHKGKQLISAKCEAKENAFFSCSLPEGTDLTKNGKLIVTSQYEKQKGNDVIYGLPLKLKILNDGHSASH